MAQRKLTKEQTDRFYQDYVRMKTKGNYAGEVLDRAVWKAQIEEILGDEATGANWSNTEIRNASHRVARTDSWSRKQVKSLLTNEKLREVLAENFGNKNIDELITQHQGAVFQFLKGYSENWNEYFNS